MEPEEHMLTTSDNPYSPFTHYDEWYVWDTSHGYDTSSYLARIAKVPIDLSDADFELAIEQAISEIVMMNVTGNYMFAVRPQTNSTSDIQVEET